MKPTTDDKLEQLRRLRHDIPDFYAVEGFRPNGCTFAPDWLPWVGTFTAYCDWHDYRYWIGGNDADRQSADWELKTMIERHTASRGWLLRRLGRWVAQRYFENCVARGRHYFHYHDARNQS